LHAITHQDAHPAIQTGPAGAEQRDRLFAQRTQRAHLCPSRTRRPQTLRRAYSAGRSHPGTPVALRHDRSARPPREIRLIEIEAEVAGLP